MVHSFKATIVSCFYFKRFSASIFSGVFVNHLVELIGSAFISRIDRDKYREENSFEQLLNSLKISET